MSKGPELSLQEAVFSHLQQDTNVQNALGSPVRLYDDPPSSPMYPFVSFGRHQFRPLDGDQAALIEQELSLHVWSRYSGKTEGLQVLQALREAVQSIPASMDDHVLIDLRVVFADTLRAKDGRVFQSILRLRALTQPIS
ncbi:MAG: hypothetical protein COA47_06455 [Robiginitomaculum sp.]|nr:MAG: hypothetical protein COA47_06455 [Robiginitomaculum sp.]